MDQVITSISPRELEFQVIPFGTPLFDESLALRTKLLRLPLGLEFTPDQIAEEWDSHHLGVYFRSGLLVASLIMKPMDKEVWKMRQVVVDDALQGKGIGKFLVLKTEEYCQSFDINKIVLHARDTAVPFYINLGYQLFGEPFEEVGIPHRAMSKKL